MPKIEKTIIERVRSEHSGMLIFCIFMECHVTFLRVSSAGNFSWFFRIVPLKTGLIKSTEKDNLSEADNRKHREQVELINELKQNESKHAETINRLEKVIFKY